MLHRRRPTTLYLGVVILTYEKKVGIHNFCAWKIIGEFKIKFNKCQYKSKYNWGKVQIPVFSRTPNTNPSTNIQILDLANTNMTIF